MMVWTNEERELIAILDNFVANCDRDERFQNSNYHSLIEQILSVTQGEVNATRKYCQQLLSSEELVLEGKTEHVLAENSFSFQTSADTVEYPKTNAEKAKKLKPRNFQLFWTLLFIILANITVFFVAKKYPNSVQTVSNIATVCSPDLIETARVGITNRDESLLQQAISDFQELQKTQNIPLGMECDRLLWEAKFIYAIDFLASQGQTKQAVMNLCAIPAEYYQNRELIPWFTRWSNTNFEFKQWFAEYKEKNNCWIATYLE